eukprot:scaffold642_cov232-Pinguiococcus_pyrenoidosus.AAC.6
MKRLKVRATSPGSALVWPAPLTRGDCRPRRAARACVSRPSTRQSPACPKRICAAFWSTSATASATGGPATWWRSPCASVRDQCRRAARGARRQRRDASPPVVVLNRGPIQGTQRRKIFLEAGLKTHGTKRGALAAAGAAGDPRLTPALLRPQGDIA